MAYLALPFVLNFSFHTLVVSIDHKSLLLVTVI